MILRGLNKGQKKEIYFCNKAKIFSTFLLILIACTSSCKIVVASKRPLITLVIVKEANELSDPNKINCLQAASEKISSSITGMMYVVIRLLTCFVLPLHFCLCGENKKKCFF